jgi:hypothetical protein
MTKFVYCLLPLVLLASCASPYSDSRILPSAVPIDFALQFDVRAPAPTPGSAAAPEGASRTPLHQPGQYVVECNRVLRVARGAGAIGDYYPQLTRVLTYDEYQSLFRLVDGNHLLSEPTSPAAQAALAQPTLTEVVYRVQITANGRTRRYSTTELESSPTAQLLGMLVRLSGLTPPAIKPDDGKAAGPG